MHENAFYPFAVRRGMIELIENQAYTHALTLNTDRELSIARIKSIFGTFCAKVDRLAHGRQRVGNIPASMRFKAIAFPEHLSTNAHLHALADLSLLKGDEASLRQAVHRCWLQSTRRAGSVDVQPLTSNGFAFYATKEACSSDPTYFLASEFHPH